MLRSIIPVSRGAVIAGIVLFAWSFGTVRSARAACVLTGSPDGALVKNLVALSTSQCERRPAPELLTRKEVDKLAATARSPEEHLRVARYYAAEADRLAGEAAAYAEAASNYQNHGVVKNLMALSTVGRYRHFAEVSCEKAKSARELAAHHEQMSRGASGAGTPAQNGTW